MISQGQLTKLMVGKGSQEDDDAKLIKQILIEVPDLVVCDEVHSYVKNETGQVQEALKSMKTLRRIGLTGTPIQNNLKEYFHMIDWVVPAFLGPLDDFKKKYIIPLEKGEKVTGEERNRRGRCSNANPGAEYIAGSLKGASERAIEKMKLMNGVFNKKTERVIQYRGEEILEGLLPPIRNNVLNLRNTRLVARLFTFYKKVYKSTNGDDKRGLFEQLALFSPLMAHPGTLLKKEEREEVREGELHEDKSLLLIYRSSQVVKQVVEGRKRLKGGSDPHKKKKKKKGERPSGLEAKGSSFEDAIALNESDDEFFEALEDEDDDDDVEEKKLEVRSVVKKVTRVVRRKISSASGGGRSSPPNGDDVETLTATQNFYGWLEEGKTKLARKCADYDYVDPTSSNKMVVLLNILAEAVTLGEKVLVFSYSLDSLNFLEIMLENFKHWEKAVDMSRHNPDHFTSWVKGRDYLRLDGATSSQKRSTDIKALNDVEGTSKVFLISTTAGGIGVNLVGASRVVLLDTKWNPAVEKQVSEATVLPYVRRLVVLNLPLRCRLSPAAGA